MKNLRWTVVAFLAAGINCGDSDAPDVPVATLTAPTADLVGDVTLSFSLSDEQERLVNVTFLVGTSPQPQAEATAADTSPPLLGLETSSRGTAHTFIWDTVADLGYVREETVHVAIEVTAGNGDGIGDVIGPVVLDNTGLPQFYDICGNVTRIPTALLGNPTADLEGPLYIGLFLDEVSCPAIGCTEYRTPQRLGPQPDSQYDFGNLAIAVPYCFNAVAKDTYKIIAVLDHNENLYTGPLVDAGDLFNGLDMLLDVYTNTTTRDVQITHCFSP